MIIPSIPPRIKFCPISARSGQCQPISTEIHFPASMNFGFLFSLLELNRCPVAPSLSLSHLALSYPLNFDRKVENKIEEQDEAKMV